MAPKELQDLLAKYLADNFGAEPATAEEDHDPQIEYRVSPAGARLVLFDWDGGQTDLHLPIRDDDHLRAVLNGAEATDWQPGNGEQRTAPQPAVILHDRSVH
jgi:hypothetical protein